jgi:hypothetical protein
MTLESEGAPTNARELMSRRWLLRALSGAVVGAVILVGLTACGGEGEDEGEEEDD